MRGRPQKICLSLLERETGKWWRSDQKTRTEHASNMSVTVYIPLYLQSTYKYRLHKSTLYYMCYLTSVNRWKQGEGEMYMFLTTKLLMEQHAGSREGRQES